MPTTPWTSLLYCTIILHNTFKKIGNNELRQSQIAYRSTCIYCIQFIIIVAEKPTIKKLQELKVFVRVGFQWDKLGIRLLDEGHQQAKLKSIEKDYKDDETRCRKMFGYWLDTHVNVTWSHLVDALRDVDMYSEAQDLEDRFNGL